MKKSKKKKNLTYWLLFRPQEGTRDIQSAVKFRMTYTLIQREPRMARPGEPLPNINEFPILNQQEASKIFEATFEKDCGDNDICESNMVTVANLDLPLGASSIFISYQFPISLFHCIFSSLLVDSSCCCCYYCGYYYCYGVRHSV